MTRVVAHTVSYPPHRRIGAELATHALMAHLAGAGWRAVVCPSSAPGAWDTYTLDGVTVARPVLADRSRPDVVIAHAGQSWPGRRHAERTGAPFVLSCHGDGGHPGWLAAQVAAARPDLVIANSEHMRANLRRAVDDSRIVTLHPPVDPARHRVERTGDRVTLVNLTGAKGAPLFWQLAELMPDTRFLGVRGGYGDQVEPPDIPNVAVIDPVADMRQVWAETAVLVVPSEYESWGMVAVEAMASGIPVVASDTPGLREALGHAGILLPRDAPAARWATAVREALGPSQDALRILARQRSAELDPTSQLHHVASVLAELAQGRMSA